MKRLQHMLSLLTAMSLLACTVAQFPFRAGAEDYTELTEGQSPTTFPLSAYIATGGTDSLEDFLK